ncbi:hypothetical protein ACOV11_24965 [Vibrio natriegens]
MFNILASHKGFEFQAICKLSVEGDDSQAIATVHFCNGNDEVFVERYPVDMSSNQGLDDIEIQILGMDRFVEASLIKE